MPQTLKIPPARWKAQRGHITELYVNQDKTLDEVIQIMAKSGFHATKPQYIPKVNVNWKLQKNYTKKKWQHARALVTKRQAERKLTELSIGGKVISEKKRKKGLRRYRASQIEEDCKRNVPEYRNLLIHRVHEVVGTSTCGVVALTPPSSNSMVVLINGLPWLNFRESFNDLIKSRPPLFSPNQQSGSLDILELASPLLSDVYVNGEVATRSLPLLEPHKLVSDLVSEYLDITRQRLFELVPILETSLISLRQQEPLWLQIFNSLVFLCSNNLMGLEESSYELLQIAISSGFLLNMKRLLTIKGPSVEIFGRHLLFMALGVEESEGIELMRFLLGSGFSPDSIDPYTRRSALYQAVKLKNRAAVHLLLTFGADPDAKVEGTEGDTLDSPVNCAIDLPDNGVIAKTLIDFGANINSGSPETPSQAVRKRNSALTRHMLKAGADPKRLLGGGLSLIYSAIYRHDWSLVNLLIEAGVNSDLLVEELQDADLEFLKRELTRCLAGPFCTPIQLAVLRGNGNIVKRLIEGGAAMDKLIEPEMLENVGQRMPFVGVLTPLQMSTQKNQGEITKMFLNAGAAIDFRHPSTATALQMACFLPIRHQRKSQLIEALLDRGADVNALPGEEGGKTAMLAAAESGDYDLLKLLWRKGSNPFASVATKNGLSVFEAALKSGSAELVTDVYSWNWGVTVIAPVSLEERIT